MISPPHLLALLIIVVIACIFHRFFDFLLITRSEFLCHSVFKSDGIVAKGSLLLFKRRHDIVPALVVVKVATSTSLNHIAEFALFILAEVSHLGVELIVEEGLV